MLAGQGQIRWDGIGPYVSSTYGTHLVVSQLPLTLLVIVFMFHVNTAFEGKQSNLPMCEGEQF